MRVMNILYRYKKNAKIYALWLTNSDSEEHAYALKCLDEEAMLDL